MKQQISETINGVQIENTLSMALQKPFQKRHKFWLILLAYLGVISSIFSFLTMFSPVYSIPVFLAITTVIFIFFAYFSIKPEHSILPILGAVILYCGLFFYEKERIANGLMYLTNHIYQVIYSTEWEYFTTDAGYLETASTTCVLCFLTFPIIWMTCYAVLRYQNFFLSFLITFPLIETGLFFGIVPNHFFAILLASFWFAMASVQKGSSGINQNAGKTGFLRKKNSFLPVSGLKFMMPEKTGIVMLFLSLLIFGGIEYILNLICYERPELFKNLRADFLDYVDTLHLTEQTVQNDYGMENSLPDNTEHIQLGTIDEKTYEEIPVTSISFSENPNTRIYLKYRVGSDYQGTTWEVFPEEIYQNPSLENFYNLDYYPSEFLGFSVSGTPIQVTMHPATNILAQCIPYGFEKSSDISCHIDDKIETFTNHYTIQGKIDYETFFSDSNAVSQVWASELLPYCNKKNLLTLTGLLNTQNQQIWISNTNPINEKSAEAGILCGTFYTDFIYDHYTSLPDTPAMQEIRNAYASELENFDAKSSSPAEIILKLQKIRNKICDNVTYTLSPGKTPDDTDHTAYFLLENQKGYCEHYATAGTVLSRMAGIPARYCEGYMLDCSQSSVLTSSMEEDGTISYTSSILDSNAHAWTEIYLNGIGWIPFEFTFSYFDSPTPSEQPASETASPVEETLPVSTISVENPAVQPSETPSVTERTEISPKLFLILILLTASAFFCILILIFRITRLIVLRKRIQSLNQEDNKASALCAYDYLTSLLEECGVQVKGKTIGTLVEESELCCSDYMDSFYNLSAAVQIGAKIRYSPHPVTKSELHYLSRTADALAEGMYQKAGFFRKFYFKWLRHYL